MKLLLTEDPEGFECNRKLGSSTRDRWNSFRNICKIVDLYLLKQFPYLIWESINYFILVLEAHKDFV